MEPMISFKSARKLRNYLLGAKIYHTERPVGSFKGAKKRCKVCKNVKKLKTLLLQLQLRHTKSITDKTVMINV